MLDRPAMRAALLDMPAEATLLAESGKRIPLLNPRRVPPNRIEEAYRLITGGGAHGRIATVMETRS